MSVDVPVLVESPSRSGPTVRLRGHGEDDVESVWEQCTDPLSQQWTTVPIPYTRDDAKRFVRQAMPGGWATDQEWAFAVEVDGRFGGTVSLRTEREGRAEVAFGSHPGIRGTGAMERALRLLLEWGFAERDLHTVVWWANRGNWASRRLAWRVGFSFDGTVRQWLPHRGELLDAWVGTLLTGDDRSPRSQWLDIPTIESSRLPIRLRAPRESDTPRVAQGNRDHRTTHWLGGIPQPYTDERAAGFALRWLEEAAAGHAITFVVADQDDDRLLGSIGLAAVDRVLGQVEVGYWTHPDERGRGVMTEAARLATRHALLPEDVGGLGLGKVYAYAAVDNAASRTVLTRAGLAETGVERLATRTRDGLADAVRHELLAGELRADG